MDRLPAELLIKIARQLGLSELVALCTVNRLIHTVAQPELYEQICLRALRFAHKWNKDRDLYNFAKTLKRRPELALFCRTLACWCYPGSKLRTIEDALSMMRPVAPTLKLFRELRDLQLTFLSISADMRSAIRSLPQLRSVYFIKCEMDPRGLDKLGLVPPQMRLEMCVYHPANIKGWDTIPLGGLQGLTLSMIDRVDPILSNLMSRGQVHALDSLDIKSNAFGNIASFLESTPRLRSLSIHSRRPESLRSLLSLPKDAIPMLQEFAGLPEYCATILSGRPVKSVKLLLRTDEYEAISMDALLSLQSSSVAITTLTLERKVLAADMQHVPRTLRRLTLATRTFEIELSEWAANALCNMQELQVLECEADSASHLGSEPRLTMPTISALAEKCPSLGEVHACNRFFPERWLKCDDGRWNCYKVEK